MKTTPLLGAHMSIAGGYYKAVEAAAECDMNTVQIFTKNNNQWNGKELSATDIELFQKKLGELKISNPLSHASYLINLASPDRALWQKSVDAFVIELERATALGIQYVVLHPGAATDGDEDEGITRVVEALDQIHTRLPETSAQCLLETTAGQGTCLGCRFEELASILDAVKEPGRLGICVDTCHIFAAGYPLIERKDYLATFRRFDDLIGVDRIKAFHLNDSKKELGSRVDRHEHIGRGKLGIEPFRHLMNDKRFRQVPMYLETPKGEEEGINLDTINRRTLLDLIE